MRKVVGKFQDRRFLVLVECGFGELIVSRSARGHMKLKEGFGYFPCDIGNMIAALDRPVGLKFIERLEKKMIFGGVALKETVETRDTGCAAASGFCADQHVESLLLVPRKPIQQQLQEIEVVRQQNDLLCVLDGVLEESKRLIDRGGVEARHRIIYDNDAFREIEVVVVKMDNEIDERDGCLLALAEPLRRLASP